MIEVIIREIAEIIMLVGPILMLLRDIAVGLWHFFFGEQQPAPRTTPQHAATAGGSEQTRANQSQHRPTQGPSPNPEPGITSEKLTQLLYLAMWAFMNGYMAAPAASTAGYAPHQTASGPTAANDPGTFFRAAMIFSHMLNQSYNPNYTHAAHPHATAPAAYDEPRRRSSGAPRPGRRSSSPDITIEQFD